MGLLAVGGQAPGADRSPSRAQEGAFAFRSYGQQEGLGNLAVFSMAQDAKGFLWAGTEDGLFRYDGHSFQEFREGLTSGCIWGMASSRQVPLWVLTEKGCFGLDGRSFKALPGLPMARMNFLLADDEGRGLSALGGHLYECQAKGPFREVKDFGEDTSGGWLSRDGRVLLVATTTGIWKRQDAAWSTLSLPAGMKGSRGWLLQDATGRIWFRGRGFLLKMEAWGLPWVDLSSRLPGNSTNAYPLQEDLLHRVWTGTSKGLLCLDGEETWALGEARGLPGGWAGPLLIDREGSLWVGSEGLHRLEGRFLWTSFGVHQGLPAPTVWDIGRGSDGRIYVCTEQGIGVQEAGGRFVTLPGTQGRVFNAGIGDRHGRLWFGGTNEGEASNCLHRFEPSTGRLERIPTPPVEPSNNLVCLASGGEDEVYLGTINDGVFRTRKQQGRWITEALRRPRQGAHDRVNGLLRDGEGRLWVARASGLSILDGDTWHELGKAAGLLGSECGGLARSPSGDIWLSYRDAAGVSRITKQGDSWKVAESRTQPAALFKDLITSLTFDRSGVLWLATGKGLKRWDGTNLEVFGKTSGLPSLDPSDKAVWVDPNNDLWLGFSNGIAHFHARFHLGTPAAPATLITDGRDGRGALALDGPAPAIPYRQNTLTFHFSALSFLDETRIIHEVRLVGLEEAWRETRINEARYPALPQGSYTLEVRSHYPEGSPGPAAAFAFRILPPWWGTWWFRGLEALTAIGAVLLGFRWRTAHLLERNALLAEMVRSRTQALEQSNEALEVANKALEQASLVDPLTGLHNRRFLDLSLTLETVQAQRVFRELLASGQDPRGLKEDMLLFMLDLDHFKQVNDTYGHPAGDAVLRQLADRLRVATRTTDTLVRWGGEEFLLVAKRAHRASAPLVAQKLLEAIGSTPFLLPNGETLAKTCSIGYTALPLHPLHPETGTWQQALEMADQCLYAAKKSGRNRWVGALVNPGSTAGDLDQLSGWSVAEATERGLLDTACSAPEFRWPRPEPIAGSV
ncbi:MAG TPA: diguanylate cyclase [Geothrix sp.]|nr:diguanylate cyclase [Geothrix sp.]